MLRQVILSAVEDGDVDKEERREIAKILSRAGHTKARVERVKAALDDGVMDDDARALLTSFVIHQPNFCPAACAKTCARRTLCSSAEVSLVVFAGAAGAKGRLEGGGAAA